MFKVDNRSVKYILAGWFFIAFFCVFFSVSMLTFYAFQEADKAIDALWSENNSTPHHCAHGQWIVWSESGELGPVTCAGEEPIK